MLPISLLRSEYQGWEYQKEKPIQDRAKMRAKKNLLLTEKYKRIYPKFIIIENTTLWSCFVVSGNKLRPN